MVEGILPVKDIVRRFRELNPNLAARECQKLGDRKDKSYSDLLLHPLWKWKRSTILELDHFCCANCHSVKHLEVHHIRYNMKRMPWEYSNDNLITLCAHCHDSFHKGNLRKTLKKKLPALSDRELDEVIITALKRLVCRGRKK